MKHYDYLIVGCGLFGSVVARELTRKRKTCLVIDKRNHIGGNIGQSPLLPSILLQQKLWSRLTGWLPMCQITDLGTCRSNTLYSDAEPERPFFRRIYSTDF